MFCMQLQLDQSIGILQGTCTARITNKVLGRSVAKSGSRRNRRVTSFGSSDPFFRAPVIRMLSIVALPILMSVVVLGGFGSLRVVP
jgi:hypothetical protein